MRSAARVLGLLPTAAAATLAVALVSGREPATNQPAPGAQSKPAARVEIIRNGEITELAYPSSDGRMTPAVLSMPRGDGPFPAVVTIHGGQGNRDVAFIRTLAVPGGISPTVTMLNEQPWAILAISYRAGGGAVLGIEQDDVVAGIRFAKTLPRIVPALFLTSLADEQVPHLMVEPTIARLKAAGGDVTVYTATKSLHGFYWGRDVGRARVGRDAKSRDELAEEAEARDQILRFFTRWFETTRSRRSGAEAMRSATPSD